MVSWIHRFFGFIGIMLSCFHRFRGVNSFIGFMKSRVSWCQWCHGFIGFVVSMVSWFHRFRGVNGFMVS